MSGVEKPITVFIQQEFPILLSWTTDSKTEEELLWLFSVSHRPVLLVLTRIRPSAFVVPARMRAHVYSLPQRRRFLVDILLKVSTNCLVRHNIQTRPFFMNPRRHLTSFYESFKIHCCLKKQIPFPVTLLQPTYRNIARLLVLPLKRFPMQTDSSLKVLPCPACTIRHLR